MAAKIRHKKWAVKIQHCPISSKCYMWVNNDVPNWFPTLKIFYRSPFLKWLPQYRTNSTLSDFNDISYVGRLWCPELILGIENFYQSPFRKWPPQHLTNSTLFDFNEISYVGKLWCPELIPDIPKFLLVSIFKMAATIPQTIQLRICQNAMCSFKLVVSGRFVRLHNR